MLHLTFAPNSKLLYQTLSELLKDLWKDPFCSPLIIIPNFVIERWLKEMIVSKWGTIVEPQISTLEKVLWDALKPSHNIKLLDQNKLQQIIVALLKKEILRKECFTPILDYIGDEKEQSYNKRRIQIAKEIAHFFLEYEYNRPSVWENNTNGKGRWKVYGVEKTWLTDKKMYFAEKVKKELLESVEKHEQWQKELYTMIFGQGGILDGTIDDKDKIRYITLPQLYIYKHDICLQKGGEIFETGEPLVIFLLNKISHFHRNMLLEISEKRDIYVFLVNVCSEFWEDIDTSRGEHSRRRWNNILFKNPPIKRMTTEEFEREELPSPQSDAENKLLALWGKSGRENVTLWCQAVDYDFEYIPQSDDNKANPSTLNKIQMSILHRQSIDKNLLPDNSITILCAPEIGREVEALRENIFEILYNDPNLRIEDIGVYVTDIKRYSLFVHKIFGAYEPEETEYIPYTIINTSSGESLFVKAIKDLLKLCEGEFTLNNIFSFLSNGLVSKAKNITAEEIEIWEKWALETGFSRGFDALHRKEMGDREEVTTDEHTFIFGMARLLLGNFAVYPVRLKLKTTLIDTEKIEPLPYTDFNTSEKDLIEKYFSIIEDLVTSCKSIVNIYKGRKTSEAVSEFVSLCNNWIEVTNSEEERVKNFFIESLLNIKLQEELCGYINFSFNYFKELVLACLPQELPPHPIKLTGNLVFYPLKAGYILPHKITFVLGLDEDSFPGYNPETQLNLLYSKRIIGDPDEVNDNRYSFLELLCATEDKLFLSWVGLDILKDKTISPSSILLELTRATGIKLPTPTVKDSNIIPLSPYEPTVNSNSARQWNPINAILSIISKDKKEIVNFQEKIFLEDKKKQIENYYEVNIEDIALFLKNPLEYHLKKTLLLKSESVTEIVSLIEEPLTSDYAFLLKKQIFLSFLQPSFLKEINIETTKGIVNKIYKKWGSAGKTPEGIFLRLELKRLKEWAYKISQNILSILNNYPKYEIVNKERDEKYFTYNFTCKNKKYKININQPFILLSKGQLKKTLLLKLSSFNNNEEWLWSKNFEMWLYSSFLTTNGIDKIENSIFSYSKGEILSIEWNKPSNFNTDSFNKWLDEIISAMVNRNECYFAPAIWFENSLNSLKKQNRTPELNELISNFKDTAYEELEKNNKFTSYKSLIDFIKIIDVSLPEDEVLFSIFKRLSPILKGEF